MGLNLIIITLGCKHFNSYTDSYRKTNFTYIHLLIDLFFFRIIMLKVPVVNLSPISTTHTTTAWSRTSRAAMSTAPYATACSTGQFTPAGTVFSTLNDLIDIFHILVIPASILWYTMKAMFLDRSRNVKSLSFEWICLLESSDTIFKAIFFTLKKTFVNSLPTRKNCKG